ncbi:MAG: hypothetical protein QM733_23120 [Ilumatobacteraceae bacterium]
MLDLDARVELDERERLLLGRDEELDGAGVDVPGRLGQLDGAGEDALAQRPRQPGGRGDLDHLLVAQLHRAVAVVEVDDPTGGVAEHLHLDVPGPLDQLLDEQRPVAERCRRLAGAAGERLGQLAVAVDAADAAATTAGRGLEHHRVADLAGDGAGLVGRRHRPVAAGDDRHADLRRQLTSAHLVPEQGEHLR